MKGKLMKDKLMNGKLAKLNLALLVVLLSGQHVAFANDKPVAETRIEYLGEPVNINIASLEQLLKVKGLGRAKANAIIRYRIENGAFKRVEDVKNVKGIGDKALNKIRNYIKV